MKPHQRKHSPQAPRTLHFKEASAIPCIDNGDHRTVGIMGCFNDGHPDLLIIVSAMTPAQAHQIAADLIGYANREPGNVTSGILPAPAAGGTR